MLTTSRWSSVIIPRLDAPHMYKRYATPHSMQYLELKPPALQTPLTQRCTCEAQLCDHTAIDNSYRVAEPWNVLDYSPDSSVPSSNVSRRSNDTMHNSFTANSVPFSSDTANGSLMSVTPAPIYSNYIGSRVFGPCDAGSTPFHPTLLSYPSASSALSSIQGLDTTQTQAYSLDDSFVQYRDHVDNNSYTRQPGGNARTGSYEHQYCSNTMYDATPEPAVRLPRTRTLST
ncbi:hypothetical protein EDD85DRAFT_950503 [Armillaria nabsnona]|nr:hypothetical protein EDD85DRAFT_950503 [Armillaria nabsnona]